MLISQSRNARVQFLTCSLLVIFLPIKRAPSVPQPPVTYLRHKIPPRQRWHEIVPNWHQKYYPHMLKLDNWNVYRKHENRLSSSRNGGCYDLEKSCLWIASDDSGQRSLWKAVAHSRLLRNSHSWGQSCSPPPSADSPIVNTACHWFDHPPFDIEIGIVNDAVNYLGFVWQRHEFLLRNVTHPFLLQRPSCRYVATKWRNLIEKAGKGSFWQI